MALIEWTIQRKVPGGVIRAGFTTVAGGVSTGGWAGLNLGTHVGDDPARVAANRAIPFAHWVTNGMLNPVNGIERWKPSEPRLGAHCRAIVGYDPDTGFLVVNSWRGWGKSHPVLNRTHPDSFTWVPVETMLDPSFSFDFHRLTRPLPVEGVDA